MSSDMNTNLRDEQVAMLKNPPAGGPFHEIDMSYRKLISDGYLCRTPSRELYELTDKGRDAIHKYENSKARE